MLESLSPALVSFVYNAGPGSPSAPKAGGFYWSTMRKLINQGKFAAAAGQFERYNHAGGVVVRGLTRRRKAEAALFMEPEPAPAPVEDAIPQPMPQIVDAPPPVITTAKAVTSSPTVAVAGIGLLASLGKAASSMWDWITEAGQQIVAAKEASGPFGELFAALHINLQNVVLAITLGSFVFVIVRHIAQKREGVSQ